MPVRISAAVAANKKHFISCCHLCCHAVPDTALVALNLVCAVPDVGIIADFASVGISRSLGWANSVITLSAADARSRPNSVRCSSQLSLTGHLNRGIDGVFEIVRVVSRGLVSIAEVHAIVTGAQQAQA